MGKGREETYVEVKRDEHKNIIGYGVIINGEEDSFYMIEGGEGNFLVYQDKQNKYTRNTNTFLVGRRARRARAERLALKQAKFDIARLKSTRLRRVEIRDKLDEEVQKELVEGVRKGCLMGLLNPGIFQ